MRALRTGWVVGLMIGAVPTFASAQYSPNDLLTKFRPSFKGVEYDTPDSKAAIEACRVETVTRDKKVVGYALKDAQGKLLRRFVDTNGKKDADGRTHLDQWSYYQDGFEVYREVDLNEDGSLDECRWMNNGGTRIAQVKAGKIIGWKRLSAEEASKIMVQALVGGDLGLLETVIATPEELQELGMPTEGTRQATEAATNRKAQFRAVRDKLKGWDGSTVWSRFDGTMPHTIPADAAAGLKNDLLLYENAVIFAGQPNGQGDPLKMAYLQVPELVRIGETWKFVGLPEAIDPSNPAATTVAQLAGGLRTWIFREGNGGGVADGVSPELKAALDDLAKFDAKGGPGAAAANRERVNWHLDRIDILRKVLANVPGADEKLGYNRQVVQDLAEAYRTGVWPEGKGVFEKLIAQGGKIASFAALRKIQVEFEIETDQPGADVQGAQKNYLKNLEAFLTAHPKSDEEPEVLYQLAINHEFNGAEKEATTAYNQLVQDYPKSDWARKATGALNRLELDGKALKLRGTDLDGKPVSVDDYRGKTLLVVFWMSEAESDRRELADLARVYQKYHDKGFEILGVNLDNDKAEAIAYVKQSSLPWAQIHEKGGMDSRLAEEFGLISSQTMFLIDPQGKVINRKIRRSVEVEKYLEKPVANRPVGLNLGSKP